MGSPARGNGGRVQSGSLRCGKGGELKRPLRAGDGEPVERCGFGEAAEFKGGYAGFACFRRFPCAPVGGGEEFRAGAECGDQRAERKAGQRDEADHARGHEAVEERGKQIDEPLREKARKREEGQHAQRRQQADK